VNVAPLVKLVPGLKRNPGRVVQQQVGFPACDPGAESQGEPVVILDLRLLGGDYAPIKGACPEERITVGYNGVGMDNTLYPIQVLPHLFSFSFLYYRQLQLRFKSYRKTSEGKISMQPKDIPIELRS